MTEQTVIPEIPTEPTAEQQVKPKRVRKKKEVDPNAPVVTPAYRDGGKFLLTARIQVLSQGNPKHAGSKAAAIWENYRDGMTVKEALEAGIPRVGLLYDSSHNFIKIEGYDAPPPVKKPSRKKADVAVDPAPVPA